MGQTKLFDEKVLVASEKRTRGPAVILKTVAKYPPAAGSALRKDTNQ